MPPPNLKVRSIKRTIDENVNIVLKFDPEKNFICETINTRGVIYLNIKETDSKQEPQTIICMDYEHLKSINPKDDRWEHVVYWFLHPLKPPSCVEVTHPVHIFHLNLCNFKTESYLFLIGHSTVCRLFSPLYALRESILRSGDCSKNVYEAFKIINEMIMLMSLLITHPDNMQWYVILKELLQKFSDNIDINMY